MAKNVYAINFYNEDGEEWESDDSRGQYGVSPWDVVRRQYESILLNDPRMDPHRFEDWQNGDVDHYKFHVIAKSGEQFLVEFDVLPCGFSCKPTRRIIWRFANVKTRKCPARHAAKYRPAWEWVSRKDVENGQRDGTAYAELRQGWYIHHFCDGLPCEWCAELAAKR